MKIGHSVTLLQTSYFFSFSHHFKRRGKPSNRDLAVNTAGEHFRFKNSFCWFIVTLFNGQELLQFIFKFSFAYLWHSKTEQKHRLVFGSSLENKIWILRVARPIGDVTKGQLEQRRDRDPVRTMQMSRWAFLQSTGTKMGKSSSPPPQGCHPLVLFQMTQWPLRPAPN